MRTSAKIGTVELTGLEMMRKQALGQLLEHWSAIPLTIDAFVLKRSSLKRITNNTYERDVAKEASQATEKNAIRKVKVATTLTEASTTADLLYTAVFSA